MSDVVIPARSQCFINAGSKDFGLVSQDNLLTPYQEQMVKQDILLGSGVVVRNIENRIPVLIMNNSESPIKLYSGTSIGQLSTVTVEDDKEEMLRPKSSEKREPANVDLSDSCLTNQQREKVSTVLRSTVLSRCFREGRDRGRKKQIGYSSGLTQGAHLSH
jgi:hypothetical protein